MGALKPFKPSAARPWDRAAAAHLLRRAGFAPSEEEVARALEEGPGSAVRRLVEPGPESARSDELDLLGESLGVRNDIDAMRGWWLLRMCSTDRPLAARMAAFWHNHFATSNAKVRSAALMLGQLRTFERLGLGPFGDLMLAVAQDPAMIVWLDAEQNVKGRPNENFARELFELFTLGVGHYSEADIKEAARAFTGWRQRAGRFQKSAGSHDNGAKTILGEVGDFGGEDAVRIAVAQPQCAMFLARKLAQEFVCPEPPDELVDEVAESLTAGGLDIGATLAKLLASEAMFDSRWRGTRIKSPVEFAIGACRSLHLRVAARALGDSVSQMGQRLFEPPTVKGWDGHRAWINSATMLVRLNAAVAATTPAAGFDPGAFRNRHSLDSNERTIEFCSDLTLDGCVPPALAAQTAALTGSPDEVLIQTLRLLLSSPEYQMA
jgi:uncharacterized protein (DUF1800 family)